MYETIRNLTVLEGGALGSLAMGGIIPGAAAGGIGGGALIDIGATIITNRPHGYVRAVRDMSRAIANDSTPFEAGLPIIGLAAMYAAGGIVGAAMINPLYIAFMAILAHRCPPVVGPSSLNR